MLCLTMLLITWAMFEGANLSLTDRDLDSSDQRFAYNEDTGEFHPSTDTTLSVSAGDASPAAGIYMSRSLTLEVSSETEAALKTWVILE